MKLSKGSSEGCTRTLSLSVDSSKFIKKSLRAKAEIEYSATEKYAFDSSVTCKLSYGLDKTKYSPKPKIFFALMIEAPPSYLPENDTHVKYDNCPWIPDSFKDAGARPYLITWSVEM